MCDLGRRSPVITAREEAALMYDRNPAYGSRGHRSRRARRRRTGSILAVGACIGALVTRSLLFSPHASRATPAADVQGYLPGTSGGGAGGWGEGGYPMMSGPPDGAVGGGAVNG